MMYCKIKDGIVVDRALFDASMPTDWPEYNSFVQNDEAQIGWSYTDGIFVEPPVLPPPEMFLPQPAQPSAEQQVLFDHENRILAQEGLPPLTMADFVTKMGAPPAPAKTKRGK